MALPGRRCRQARPRRYRRPPFLGPRQPGPCRPQQAPREQRRHAGHGGLRHRVLHRLFRRHDGGHHRRDGWAPSSTARPSSHGPTFHAKAGSLLRVAGVLEGFRYYVGFAGRMDLPRVMGSFSTNIECAFGGFKGRPLVKGDRIGIAEGRRVGPKGRAGVAPAGHGAAPRAARPRRARRRTGSRAIPSISSATSRSICGTLCQRNRTGRASGSRASRWPSREGAAGSIISEGILPGTVQVPPDGKPIIMLYERTMGGYARAGVVDRPTWTASPT